MKKLLLSLAAVCMLAVVNVVNAQPEPKILVVDMAKLFEGHYKLAEQKAKMDANGQRAQQVVDGMQKELTALADKYKSLDDQFKNPALSDDAKKKIASDGQATGQEIQSKRTELQQFYADTQRSMQAQFQNFHDMLMDEIGKVAIDVAKRHGATLVLDKSGVMLGSGYHGVVFSDPSYDITDEVAAEIAKNKPAGPTPVAPSIGGSTPSAPSSSDTSSGISIPNVTPAGK